MRIVQLHWAALPTTGGVEAHLETLVAGLRAAGDEVTFLAGTRQARTATFHPALLPGGRSSADELDDLAGVVARHDLLHLHNPQWHRPETVDALLARLDARGWPGPRVLGVHNLAPDGPHADRLRRWPVQCGRSLVAHSRFVAAELAALVPGVDVLVLPLALPVDRDGGRRRRRAGRTPVVLQPTRLSTWKGSQLSLAAAADLLEAGRDLVFIHAGSEHLLWDHGIDADLLARIRPWRERGRVRFVHFPPERSWAAIRDADLIVHPTAGVGARGEPYSMSVAQAVLCGRPVVVSRSGNLPELVRDYPAARLVDPGDAAGLRLAIDAFLAGQWPASDGLGPRRAAVARLRAWHAGAIPGHRSLYRAWLSASRSTDGFRRAAH